MTEPTADQLLNRFTERAKKVCELALREALSLGCNYIGTEHLLLALEREQGGLGGDVLRREAPEIRDRVVRALTGRRMGVEQEAARIEATMADVVAALEAATEAARALAEVNA